MSSLSAAVGPPAGVGNCKGVMLCARPCAAGAGAGAAAGRGAVSGKAAFTCGTVKRAIGRERPTVDRERRQEAHGRQKATALARHRKWLRELQRRKERLEEECRAQEEGKRGMRERFRAREARMRQAARALRGDRKAAPEKLAAALEGEAENPSRPTGGDSADKADEADGRSAAQDSAPPAEAREAKGRAGVVAAAGIRPLWALTEAAAAEAEAAREEEEEGDLLAFAEGLDIDRFLEESEVLALLAGTQARIDAMERAGREEEQEELRALKEHRYRLEERQRAEEEMRAKLRRSVPGAEPRPASRGTQSEASGSANAAARADADEHDGAGDALPPTPRPATADPATGWAPCAEAKPADAPERMGPKIVTHRIDDGSRLEIRKDVSHLPYMHRNPAV